MASSPLLRIGELSKRTGVTAELLRAWEPRYGLLPPARSSGGVRPYVSADVERVRRMQRHPADGLAAASRAVVGEAAPPPVLSSAPVRAAVARPLIEGLRNPTVADDDRIRHLLPFPLTGFCDAARRALDPVAADPAREWRLAPTRGAGSR